MVTFEHVEEIDRSVEDVFAYVTDVSRLPEWQSGVREATMDGELRLGGHVEERRRFAGRDLTLRHEVTELDPPHRFTLEARSGPVPFTARHVFEPNGNGTRLTFHGAADPPRVLRLTQRIVTKVAEREFRSYFRRLKEILEEE